MKRKLISIVTPCYNEEENVDELCDRIALVMKTLPYNYEHIFIDNSSNDSTVEKIKIRAKDDKHIKLIVNARNFGHVRSGYHAILQTNGDACICIAADLQDPPEMIPEFIAQWENGFKIALAIKPECEEHWLMFNIRKLYYKIIGSISDIPLVKNTTGAGLFDKAVVDIIRKIDDPYPYFRGLLSEIGYPIALIPFRQPRRARGITKNNFYTLYDLAMLGVTKHSKIPLRLMTMAGFSLSIISLLIAATFFVRKLIYWDTYQLGLAPMLIGLFFFGAMQMLFIGLLGEYVGAIYTHVRKLPLVIEEERINFDENHDEIGHQK